MAQSLASSLATVSGITWIDIVERSGATPKTLSTITEDDWINIGGFREGTFNFTGDEMTVTDQKYENGQNIVSTTKDGTYGFEGNLPNVAKEICEKLLRMESLTLTPSAGAYVEGREVLGYGKEIGLLENVFIRLRFEQGYWHSLVYPNASISSRFQGAGSSEDLLDISVQGSTSKSTDTDTLDQIWLFIERI